MVSACYHELWVWHSAECSLILISCIIPRHHWAVHVKNFPGLLILVYPRWTLHASWFSNLWNFKKWKERPFAVLYSSSFRNLPVRADLIDKVCQLVAPDTIAIVDDTGFVTSAKAQQIHSINGVVLGQLRDDVAPMVGRCSKPMNQNYGRLWRLACTSTWHCHAFFTDHDSFAIYGSSMSIKLWWTHVT